MSNEKEIRQKAIRAAHEFEAYSAGFKESTRRVVRVFCRERPEAAGALVEFFNVMRPGINCLPARVFTRAEAKVRIALEDAAEVDAGPGDQTQWIRRHKLLFTIVTLVLLLPMILSPTHPIAVYSYLADSHESFLTPQAFADSSVELRAFLISPAQVERYRAELPGDVMDTRTGRLFAIVQSPDGTLKQESVRTWSAFLPIHLPSLLKAWLDRKELPYLGDEVGLWLQGNEIIAMGHYHAFGGGPSAGDMKAQRFSDLPEVVVANATVPMVYIRGKLVPYGEDVMVPDDVFRMLRPVERNLLMNGTMSFSWSEEPSEALKTYLAFLRDYRNVDINSRTCVAQEVFELGREFEDQYRPVFTKGITLVPYANDPDKLNLLNNWVSVQAWAAINRQTPPDNAA